MRERDLTSVRLVDNFEGMHLESFTTYLVIKIIPVWLLAIELLQWLNLKFAEVASEEESRALAAVSGIKGTAKKMLL